MYMYVIHKNLYSINVYVSIYKQKFKITSYVLAKLSLSYPTKKILKKEISYY